ncbi:hypothetical protein BDZ91DRAFT_794862 [Kalaharituber pfeilii]|nr:hypothetical protein BDZ91DRAFT_794862 [Kalaharituber pfeilii]
MAATQDNLLTVLKAKDDLENRERIAGKLVSQIKMSAFFEVNWEDLLMAAPVAISNIGKLYAASSSREAQTIQLNLGKEGKKNFNSGFIDLITLPSLKANLVACGDMGRFAFVEAENCMGKLQDLSPIVEEQVSSIIKALGDPGIARRFLRTYMNALKESADKCHQAAKSIDEKFEDWLKFITALHAVSENTSTVAETSLAEAEINLAATKVMAKQSEQGVQDAKKSTENLAKALNTARDAFQKASENYPSGWEIVGQQIVSDLASAVTTALSQGISAYISNMNPMAKAKTGVDIFDNVIHPEEDRDKGTDGSTETTLQQPREPVRAATRPRDSDDPAFVHVIKDNPYLTTLNALLTGGKDGSVNWESAAGLDVTTDAAKATSTAAFVIRMLTDSQQSFQKEATNKVPSKTYLSILETALKVANDLKVEADKGKQLNHSWPKEDDPIVKSWQQQYAPKYQLAVQMVALARALPGNIFGGAPLMTTYKPDPQAQVAQINAKSAQAKALLDAAQNRLTTTQTALANSQKVYHQSTELLVQQENRLGDLKAQMDKLTHSKLSLEETKKVLARCIQIMIPLKENVTKLVRYFEALSGMIDIQMKSTVDLFLKFIQGTVSPERSDPSDPSKELRNIGNYTIMDFERSHLFQFTLTIDAYFSLLGDIARMWRQVSRDHIFPGVKLADNVSITVTGEHEEEERERSVKRLSDWADSAREGIKTIVGKKRQEILGGMENTVQEVTKTIQMLPPSPQEIITRSKKVPR